MNISLVTLLKMYGRSKPDTLINSNTNCRREMKLIPINVDYYLLEFDALIIFLGVRLHGGSVTNFSFFLILTAKFGDEIVMFAS